MLHKVTFKSENCIVQLQVDPAPYCHLRLRESTCVEKSSAGDDHLPVSHHPSFLRQPNQKREVARILLSEYSAQRW